MKHWSGILLIAVFICVLSAPAFAGMKCWLAGRLNTVVMVVRR